MRGVPAKTPERVAEAQRMRAEGCTYREIAERFGIAKNTAFEWVTDPDGSFLRDRKRLHDLVCVVCGGRAHGTDKAKMADPSAPVCHTCAPAHYSIWTDEAIVLAIQEWADDHGGIPPSATDFQRAKSLGKPVPTVWHVQYRFGAWSAAVRAAGFEPHAAGPVGGYTVLTPAQRVECARRYADGESSVEIAADLGCAPQTVTRWARRAGVQIRKAVTPRRAAA